MNGNQMQMDSTLQLRFLILLLIADLMYGVLYRYIAKAFVFTAT